jgi:hypothetical protein
MIDNGKAYLCFFMFISLIRMEAYSREEMLGKKNGLTSGIGW